MSKILEIKGLSAGYGSLRVIHDFDLIIETGERGRPTSLKNEAWLAGTSRKSSSPVNNYKDGYYGVERKSALNMLGIQSKSPLKTL